MRWDAYRDGRDDGHEHKDHRLLQDEADRDDGGEGTARPELATFTKARGTTHA
jgi:hypothetical protein